MKSNDDSRGLNPIVIDLISVNDTIWQCEPSGCLAGSDELKAFTHCSSISQDVLCDKYYLEAL